MSRLPRLLPLTVGACLLAALCSPLVQNQALAQAAPIPGYPAAGGQAPPGQVYDKLLSGMEKEFVDAAEAMPEDKYNFAPTQGEFKGVRTFGQQIKHVAEANSFFFHDPSKTISEDSSAIEKLTTKAEIVAALKASFADAHAYLATITPQNVFEVTKGGTRGGMAAFGIAHFMDHYGQIVVYLRLNGIVPPASRGSGN